MAQFVPKIEKLSHIIGAHDSQDLRSPSPIMAPVSIYFCFFCSFFIAICTYLLLHPHSTYRKVEAMLQLQKEKQNQYI